jgi:hypothetical protein
MDKKKKDDSEIVDLARDHLGAIDLICRLLFLAAATPEFHLNRHAIGHLAGILYHFRNRHAEILAREGV